MKKIALLGIVALAIALTPLLANAADEAKTLKGEPVCIQCYSGGKSGEGHAACGTACAGKGLPVGFLTDEGGKKQLYLVMGGGGKAAKDILGPLMGKQVEAKGAVSDKDGLKIFTVTEAK